VRTKRHIIGGPSITALGDHITTLIVITQHKLKLHTRGSGHLNIYLLTQYNLVPVSTSLHYLLQVRTIFNYTHDIRREASLTHRNTQHHYSRTYVALLECKRTVKLRSSTTKGSRENDNPSKQVVFVHINNMRKERRKQMTSHRKLSLYVLPSALRALTYTTSDYTQIH